MRNRKSYADWICSGKYSQFLARDDYCDLEIVPAALAAIIWFPSIHQESALPPGNVNDGIMRLFFLNRSHHLSYYLVDED